MTRPVQLGTVIEGTLRNEDLLNAFTGEIEYLMAGYLDESIFKRLIATQAELYNDAKEIIYQYETETDVDESIASEIVNELIDAINEYRLPYTYFGTLEGDGADFGWWVDFDNLNESVRESESITQDLRSNGRLSDEESWIQECDCQENDCIGKHGFIVHVNDHGNVTLLDHNRKDVWAAV